MSLRCGCTPDSDAQVDTSRIAQVSVISGTRFVDYSIRTIQRSRLNCHKHMQYLRHATSFDQWQCARLPTKRKQYAMPLVDIADRQVTWRRSWCAHCVHTWWCLERCPIRQYSQTEWNTLAFHSIFHKRGTSGDQLNNGGSANSIRLHPNVAKTRDAIVWHHTPWGGGE